MIFHAFNSQAERREFGGSAFVELQFCKMPSTANIKHVVSVKSIRHWQGDSLYIYMDDMDDFYKEYCSIFLGGTYHNLGTGVVDLHGINYYAPIMIDRICEAIIMEKPSDYQVVLKWLDNSKKYNGFYILGI